MAFWCVAFFIQKVNLFNRTCLERYLKARTIVYLFCIVIYYKALRLSSIASFHRIRYMQTWRVCGSESAARPQRRDLWFRRRVVKHISTIFIAFFIQSFISTYHINIHIYCLVQNIVINCIVIYFLLNNFIDFIGIVFVLAHLNGS